MNPRILILYRLAVGGVALAALSLAGCTVYRDPDPGNYESSYSDEAGYADSVDDSYAEFSELDYWGQWFELSPYGSVWRPTVVMDWEPFTNGQWMWTNYGWTWVSYEPFGWATDHYGWWVRDFAWGWVWIPGYEWHPARVEWITYDDCIAWTPLRPRGMPIGDPWTYDECDCWHVVPIDHFTDDNVGRHTISYKERNALQERSSILYHEPDVAVVQTVTHRTIQPIKVDLVRASKETRVEKIKLPSDQARIVERYRAQTEETIRPKEAKRVPRAEPPAREDRMQDTPPSPPQQAKEPAGGGTVGREPPPRKEQPKKEKPVVEKPKKEQPKKREPVKKPKKEEPKKEEPKKEEPKKDDPNKRQPKKETR